jgi:predicted carbohydrate-binding protein with CBM5 and CBM33 domain
MDKWRKKTHNVQKMKYYLVKNEWDTASLAMRMEVKDKSW